MKHAKPHIVMNSQFSEYGYGEILLEGIAKSIAPCSSMDEEE